MSQTFKLTDLDAQARALFDQSLSIARDRRLATLDVWLFMAYMYQSEDPSRDAAVSTGLVTQGLNQDAWVNDLDAKMSASKKSEGVSRPSIDALLGKVLTNALDRSRKRGGTQATVNDIWVELLMLPEVASQLDQFGVKREGRLSLLANLGVSNPSQEDPNSFVSKYCRDLTQAAGNGELDPIVGRDDEIREAMNILQRRYKNNPIFVGEPGVGKTAMVEGLAQRMIKNEVPETLKNKSLLSLDLGAIVAGAKYKGELEERVKGLLKEMQERDDVVLFIDEIHTLVNASGEAGGVGQLLKPALARGELRCIGATTPDEYRVHLEKDPALERRFEKITVLEPSLDDAIAIMRGIKDKYALHHGVDITDQALVAAVQLSSRYMTDRNLPDKAIDLMDSAAARVRTMLDSKPESIDRLERRLVQLKVQREGLKKEEILKGELDEDTRKHLRTLEAQIDQCEQQALDIGSSWESEKLLHDKVLNVQQKISSAKVELEKHQREQNLGQISEVQFGLLPKLEEELRQAKRLVRAIEQPMMQDQVSADLIAEVVSRRTGIPVAKMGGGEQQRLATMEEALNAQVIGQPLAVESVSDAVRRSRSGLGDPKRPIGSFLFSGSTGVGKTELCKVLSSFLFDRSDAMVRIDMSEFMEKQSVSRMIGPPPGYIGYEEGGVLTEAIRQHPYSVILFDEVEKAHPDVFNVLLQVLDEGHLTDGRGRTVDFKNTVIIMTSNLGASDIQALTQQGATFDVIKDSVLENAKSFFKPEFLNRIDEVVVFQPLDKPAIGKIAQLQIKSLVKRLADRKIDLVVSQAAIDHLATAGFDPAMGARPLKRAIQQELENPLAKDIVSGVIASNQQVIVDAAGGKLSWTSKTLADQGDMEQPALSTLTVAEKISKQSTPKPRRAKQASM